MVYTIYSIEKNEQPLYKVAVNSAEIFPIKFFKNILNPDPNKASFNDLSGQEVHLEDFYDFDEKEEKEFLFQVSENVWKIKKTFDK